MINLPRQTKTILFILETGGFAPQYAGLTRYGYDHGWKTITINCHVKGHQILHADTRKPLAYKDLKNSWHPDGIIIDHNMAEVVAASWPLTDIPMVFADRRAEEISPKAICVTSNSYAIALAAARELMALGYSHYAFVPNLGNEEHLWSIERAEAFQAIIHGAGAMLHRFEGKPDSPRLHKWLRQLPLPCGIFAASDASAALIRAKCLDLDLRIPEDISLVGVDNHLHVCEGTEPTITSIQQDLEDCYFQSAQLMDEILANPHTPHQNRTFGILRIVRRSSTRPLKAIDYRVKKALEFIRLHACEHITPAQVVSTMECRRSYADRRFRECTGRSIGEEIADRRVQLVKDALMMLPEQLDDVSASCGFTSTMDMRRVFKKLTGMTPRAWQKRTLSTLG